MEVPITYSYKLNMFVYALNTNMKINLYRY